MLNPYIPVLLAMIVCGIFLFSMLFFSIVLGPKRHSKVKDEPFECGSVPTGKAHERQNVKFYLVAIIFLLFDVEIAYIYPWAIQLQKLGWQAFWAMAAFLMILILGLAYEWKKGILDWS